MKYYFAILFLILSFVEALGATTIAPFHTEHPSSYRATLLNAPMKNLFPPDKLITIQGTHGKLIEFYGVAKTQPWEKLAATAKNSSDPTPSNDRI